MNANNGEDMGVKDMGEQPSGGTGSSKLIMPLAVALIVLALAIVGAAAWFSFGSKAADGVVVVTEPAPVDGPTGNQPTVPAETNTSPEKTAFVPLAFPASLPSPAQVVKLPILMFHHTGEPPAGADELRQGLTVSTADLEAQMAYLKQAGYQPVSETQLFKALYGGAPLPPNPVMLTFDDGYVDNYQVVVPILEKYDFPATFYIVTDLVGTPEYMSWDQIVELNLSSCMALTRALVPQMKQRRWGRVIHISSIMGLASKDARNVYSATKSGLIGLARASALDLGEHNITVNCIAPGPFLTDLPGSILSPEQKKALASRTALNRWGEPRELAGPALLLASEAGSYITGAVLVVDGGSIVKTF